MKHDTDPHAHMHNRGTDAFAAALAATPLPVCAFCDDLLTTPDPEADLCESCIEAAKRSKDRSRHRLIRHIGGISAALLTAAAGAFAAATQAAPPRLYELSPAAPHEAGSPAPDQRQADCWSGFFFTC